MHLGLVMLRGTGVQAASAGNVVEDLIYKAESHLEAADIAAFVRMGAYEALLSGTGLVWEHYFEGAVLAETLREMGLCAVVGPTLEDRGGPAADQWQVNDEMLFLMRTRQFL